MQNDEPTGASARQPEHKRLYRGWASPLSARAIAAGARSLAELRSCGDTLYWLESRPEEHGRTTLLCADVEQARPPAAPRELTPAPRDVRGRIHEYGGGAFLPSDDGVFFVDAGDGEVHHLAPDGTTRTLTDCRGRIRFGDFCWDAPRRSLLAVCERPAGAEPDNTGRMAGAGQPDVSADVSENLLVAIPVGGAPVGPGQLRVLHRGHDFYAAPRLSPAGDQLAFVAWDHPNMPWDGTLLKLGRLDAAGAIVAEIVVAGSANEAVQQPVWTADGALVFVGDQNGFWNLYRYDESGIFCLLEDGAEYAEAPWSLGQTSVATLGPTHLVAARLASGSGELVVVDARGGFATPLPAGWLEYHSLCAVRGGVAFIGARDDGPPAIVMLRLQDAVEHVVARETLPALDPARITRAEPRTFRTRDGAHVHTLVYLPRPADPDVPPDARPPLLVTVHGGPTARASAALNLRVQYFTSRGWAVLDVDYRGSSGYGRRYREALNGRWGVLDVTDCEDAVRALLHEGKVDPTRVAIRGSSAGGFTVLSALAASGLYGAGTSLYGIGDLVALARATHKFESRYLDALVGDDTARAARSPVLHAAQIRCGVLFLQGADDRVVPAAQATTMAAALRGCGVPVAYVEFPGEGHGFRQADHIERALESEYAFYCRVLGIEPAESLPSLEIANL